MSRGRNDYSSNIQKTCEEIDFKTLAYAGRRIEKQLPILVKQIEITACRTSQVAKNPIPSSKNVKHLHLIPFYTFMRMLNVDSSNICN